MDTREWRDASTAGRLGGAKVALDGILTILEAEVGPAEINDPPAAELYHDALNTVHTLYDDLDSLISHLAKKYVLDE